MTDNEKGLWIENCCGYKTAVDKKSLGVLMEEEKCLEVTT